MANYYIAIDSQRRGPFPEDQLVQNGLTPDTLVWCNGMAGWTRAREVPELAMYLTPQQVPEVPQFAPQYNQPQYGYDQGQPQYGYNPNQPQYGYDQGQYQQGYGENMPPCPHNFLWWAILSTILCSWPFGIPAIVNASKVKSDYYYDGDYEMAKAHAKRAMIWSLVSTIVGLVIGSILFFGGGLDELFNI